MALNLGTILQASATERPGHPALRLHERALTYAQLDRAARGVASALRARGIAPGDRVALLIPNVPEFTIAYFGVLYAGAVVVPINVLAAGPEIHYFLEDSGAKLLLAHPFFTESARRGAADAGVPLVLAGGGAGKDTLEEMQEAAPVEALHATGADDTAVILYTSGTTGKPKGAELTHSNLFLNCAFVVPRLLPPIAPDRLVTIACLPLFHSFGQTCIQNATIARGGTFTLLPRFGPKEAYEILERDRVTLFAGVPTMYFALLHHPPGRDYDLSALELCMCGGAPMPVEVMTAFEKRFGVPVLEGFGLSETSPAASFNVVGKPRKVGSIGYPVWGVEMAIVDDQDRPLPDGERGEIVVRGHNVMKGYWKRPEATAETLRNGWFHTGDIGTRDEDGCYWIVDRKKDMILRGGFNVYPREVEEVLYQHEAVAEAAVLGVAHDSHGEEVKAVVALKAGRTATAEELIAWCKERLAAYKYPRLVEFRDALPKGPTGKILKRELR
ncbi:MAG: long-chain fatty acid--CoA ligase [Deltaproteobacteria bacterium]|nr:long-chain fatty acid--CoA ligase [Deltaproteobacteria bacterium]